MIKLTLIKMPQKHFIGLFQWLWGK